MHESCETLGWDEVHFVVLIMLNHNIDTGFEKLFVRS